MSKAAAVGGGACADGRTDGRTDDRTDGRADGRAEGRIDDRIDGRIDGRAGAPSGLSSRSPGRPHTACADAERRRVPPPSEVARASARASARAGLSSVRSVGCVLGCGERGACDGAVGAANAMGAAGPAVAARRRTGTGRGGGRSCDRCCGHGGGRW